MAELCIHELDPAACSYCSGRDGDDESAAKARDEDLIRRRRAIRAAYGGTCGGCGERFAVGDAISSRGDGPWRASCCLDDQGAPTR